MPCQRATRGQAAATPRHARRGPRPAWPSSILGRSSGTLIFGSRTTQCPTRAPTIRTLSSTLTTPSSLSSTLSSALPSWISPGSCTTSSSPGAARGSRPRGKEYALRRRRSTVKFRSVASQAGPPAASSGTCPPTPAFPLAVEQALWPSASMCTTRTATFTRTPCRRMGSAFTTRQLSGTTQLTAPQSLASGVTEICQSPQTRNATL
mmetsp:Transcript_25807/g.53522  ORF Transcript_25807/g.53522 Transcript_25807/m.53522 type:complete len:207 (+) Transcript_25807:412-1032(+)